MEAAKISMDRGMGKENVLCKYNGILASHKKGRVGFSWTERDELRAGHSELSQSAGEKQIPYTNAYMRNLKNKNDTDDPVCRAETETQM